MANINARTRLLVGTTAQWAANDLVLGDGELVIERAASVKLKVGNGAAKYSALPFVTAEPAIPAEYMTQDESDARYLLLTDVTTTSTANNVPRMGASGTLAYPILGIPAYVDSSAGAADAGKLVQLDPAGKIDGTMIKVTTGGYKGTANVTAAKPAGTYIPGDYFINTGAGTAHASWGLPGGTIVSPGQQIIFNGTAWDLVGGAGSAVLLGDGTAAAPSLAFLNSPSTGLFRGINADTISVAIGGTEYWRYDSSGRHLGFGAAAIATRLITAGITPKLQVGGTSSANSGSGAFHWSTSAGGTPGLYFGRGRGTFGTFTTVVQLGDTLGTISAAGADGTRFTEAARIAFEVDNTPGLDDMPGRIVFMTTPNGGLQPVTVLTLGSDKSAAFTGAISGLTASLVGISPTPLALERTGSTVNANISYATTLGIVYAGTANGTNFAIGASSNLGGVGNSWLTVSAASLDLSPPLNSANTGRFGGATQGWLGAMETGGSGATANGNGDTLVLDSGGNCGLSILAKDTATASIYFGNQADPIGGRIFYTQSNNVLNFHAASLPAMTISATAVSIVGATDFVLADQAPTSTLSGGFRGVPQNLQTGSYTCVLTDAGKHLYHNSATTGHKFTIPANGAAAGAGAYPIGTALTFINSSTSATVGIEITTDTLRLAGAGTTGARTLAANGIATAVKTAATSWLISGTGLT